VTLKGVRRFFNVLLVIALSLAAGCTTNDSFTFPDPLAEVTLLRELYSRNVNGVTMYWGTVKNTGDVDVENVSMVIDVFGVGGALLGRFRGIVSQSVEEEAVVDDLAIDEIGSFLIITSVPFGTESRVEHHTEFTLITLEGE
jgi:hypothetical protein